MGMSQELKRVHAYCIDKNIDVTKLMNIIVRTKSGNTEMVGKVDYESLDVSFSEPVDSDIVFDVFVNRAMFDSVATDMVNDTFYSQPESMTRMNIVIYDSATESLIEQPVRVYFFENEADMSSTEINKSLRVNTPYGIGYVGLVQEGDPSASDLKICLGTNKYGNYIIRCFEKAE